MFNSTFSRQLQLSCSLLMLWGANAILFAQLPAHETPAIEGNAAHRNEIEALGRDFSWSRDGKWISFVRTIVTPGRLIRGSPMPDIVTTEISGIDTSTGKEKLLVSGADLASALGGGRAHPSLQNDDEEASAKRKQLQAHAWSQDGRRLLLASDSSLVWFDLEARTSRPLAANGKHFSDSEISPDGRFVSFVLDHALWLADAKSGAARALTAEGNSDLLKGEPDWSYRHELGLHSAYWWSPDSASIAWLETDDHAVNKYFLRTSDGDEQPIAYPKPGESIPVVHLFTRGISGGKTLQVDLGSDNNVYIPRVQWLPDGKHLAIERLSRNQKTLDLLLADAATGKTQVILTEKDTYWLNLDDGLHFMKDSHRFVWASERSGYRHLYLYDTTGRQLAQLTHGEWEVISPIGVDETAGVVYFTATEASPLERQLYRVALDGSGFRRITQEKGTHDPWPSPAGNVLVDTWSDHSTPPRQYLLRTDGTRIARINDKTPESLASNQLPVIEFLTIKSHMGQELNAWMMKPLDFDPARHYPVILYASGGPGEQIVRDAWGGNISLWCALMAQKGYIVFALDSRGTAGRGHFFEEPIHLRFSASEMADLRDGVLYLHSQPWVDKGRIGICGWGYGGFLALHGMLDRPQLFKAGFAGSPITDWHLYDAIFTERYLEDPVHNQDGWLSSSPLENAENLKGPLLLAQATLDEKVHMENSLMLLDELLDKGKYADIVLFPDRHDLFEDSRVRQILFDRLTDFFLKNL